MTTSDDKLPILYAFEKAIVNVYRRNPDMSDHVVKRAYEALQKHVRAGMHEDDLPSASGLDGVAFDAVHDACVRLVNEGTAKDNEFEALRPVSHDVIKTSLGTLIKSVDRHTKSGGRQGYVSFLCGFIP